MSVRQKSYELTCGLEPRIALARVKELLSTEGVKVEETNCRIRSFRTPVAIIGIQPRMYTRRNWVGINPFVCVSGVEATFESIANGRTKVTIQVNQLRAYLIVAFWVAIGYFAARGLDGPWGAVLFIAVAVVAWAGVVWFVGGRLVRIEIGRVLR